MKNRIVIPTGAQRSGGISLKRDPSTSLGMTFFILLTLAMTVLPAYALTVDAKLDNPKLEARAQALFREIRCVVCQSEAISDSPSQVASDMRAHIRTQITEGKSDDEIKNYLVSQYGERVLMRPKMNERNALLWFGPLVILLAGGFIAWRSVFRGQR